MPPDPAIVAPKVDLSVATTVSYTTQFLYSGSNPIQTGVVAGTIDAKRAAVIRGNVSDINGNPISGVTITLLNHPEYGQTLSRVDGWFDMAVNGGGLLTINYQKTGYLPVQRQVNAPWQDYINADDVIMLSRDPTVTAVDLSGSTTFQVARGNMVTDASGSRQATVLFPAGTTAQVYNPDGSTKTVNSLHLHFTEFTVGPNGPNAMPAPLPPTSDYTYAVEIGSDEVTTKIAGKDVLFNQPVYYYLDNFLGFPVGIPVPVGYYDQDKAAWIPDFDGRIVKIVSITNGMADLDTDGNNVADNDPVLGITDAERTQLAMLYSVGKTFERVPLTHFSLFDLNYPSSCAVGQDCPTPNPPPVSGGAGPNNDVNGPCNTGPTTVPGSIIECENQILGESIPVVGTPYSLNYRSDRTLGHKTSYTLDIPITDSTVPSNLKKVVLNIEVAGRLWSQTFTPAPNQNYTFTWDGLDIYGQPLRGAQQVKINLAYGYPGAYNLPPNLAAIYGVNSSSFGQTTGQPLLVNLPSSRYFYVHQNQGVTVSVLGKNGPTEPTAHIGGWSLNAHHHYDPLSRVLYLGDGTRRSGNGAVSEGIITTIAGSGQSDFTGALTGVSGDGGLALQAILFYLQHITVAPDGSVYFIDFNSIRKINTDGIITTVVGSMLSGFSGDGGPANLALLNSPLDIDVTSDGSLYIADSGNNRIRRVGPDGIITTIVGIGQPNYTDLIGDGG